MLTILPRPAETRLRTIAMVARSRSTSVPAKSGQLAAAHTGRQEQHPHCVRTVTRVEEDVVVSPEFFDDI
ncbi:MAG: hypothetical protein V9E94_10865 [Microthrixaceae bacterium]